MIEKEKLIKWLEVEWLELYGQAEDIRAYAIIEKIILEINEGTLDAFNHKGCQKI